MPRARFYETGNDVYHVWARCVEDTTEIRYWEAVERSLNPCTRCFALPAKICTKCQQCKTVGEFSHDRSAVDGLSSACRACDSASSRTYARNNRDKMNESQRRWKRRTYARDRDKHRARDAVYKALKRGKITKPDQCQKCDGPGPIQAHHEDYDRQLDVLWVCDGCHDDLHIRREHVVRTPHPPPQPRPPRVPRPPPPPRSVPIRLIQDALKDRNLAEVSRRCGLSLNTVYHIFHQGKKSVRRVTVEKLEAGLGIKILAS